MRTDQKMGNHSPIFKDSNGDYENFLAMANRDLFNRISGANERLAEYRAEQAAFLEKCELAEKIENHFETMVKNKMKKEKITKDSEIERKKQIQKCFEALYHLERWEPRPLDQVITPKEAALKNIDLEK